MSDEHNKIIFICLKIIEAAVIVVYAGFIIRMIKDRLKEKAKTKRMKIK